MWLTILLCCRDPDVSAFLDAREGAICARHARCDTLTAAGFADEAACLDALSAAARALAADGALACPAFNPDAADACLAAWSEPPCDEAPDVSGCDAVCTED